MLRNRSFVSYSAAALATLALVAMPACSSLSGSTSPQAAASINRVDLTQVLPADATQSAFTSTGTAFCQAKVAIIAAADDISAQLRAASLTRALGAPTLLTGADKLSDKLATLGVEHVLTVGSVKADLPKLDVRPAPTTASELAKLTGLELAGTKLPQVKSQAEAVQALLKLGDGTVFETDDAVSPSSSVTSSADATFPKLSKPVVSQTTTSTCATATSSATAKPTAAATATTSSGAPANSATPSGATDGNPVVLIDPSTATVASLGNLMVTGAKVISVKDSAKTATNTFWPVSKEDRVSAQNASAIVALGESFGSANDMKWRQSVLRSGAELPGGGTDLFAGKRYVALYGTPVTPALGVLGEQDLAATVKRATEQAQPYKALTQDTVVPALEVIVTVASGSAGGDKNFSNEWPADDFIPMVKAAADAGQYVIIDFQPGRADFLTQVRQYEKLLAYPNVGIALDPEWRLGPDEEPLSRIGSVEAKEVNQVIDYLANYVSEHGLPQKMVVLHQFQIQMLRDRDQIHTNRPQTPVLIHADGQGSQHDKQGTWKALHEDAPANVHWGWKNFIDEDKPMLTPQQTYSEVDPLPDLVTYQ